MKTLSQAFKTTASGDTNKPVEIYDLFLDSTTLHFVNYDKNIDFFDLDGTATTYSAIPISREAFERTTDNPINSIVVKTANVDRAMSAYLATDEFRGRRITIRKVFTDQLTASGDAAVIFDGVMDSPAADENVCQVSAVDRIGTLNRKAPKRWYQLLCNWKFGNEQCFFGQTSGDMYGQIQAEISGDATSTALNLKSQNLTQANDYWRDGEVKFATGQNAGKKRKVLKSSGDIQVAYLDISLPYVPASGDKFNIYRGCDKSHKRCSGDFNNDANFGGFDTVPQEMVIR